jgi:hypothetical protein
MIFNLGAFMGKAVYVGTVVAGSSQEEAITSFIKTVNGSEDNKKGLYSVSASSNRVFLTNTENIVKPVSPLTGANDTKLVTGKMESIAKALQLPDTNEIVAKENFKLLSSVCTACDSVLVANNRELLTNCIVCGSEQDQEEEENENVDLSIVDDNYQIDESEEGDDFDSESEDESEDDEDLEIDDEEIEAMLEAAESEEDYDDSEEDESEEDYDDSEEDEPEATAKAKSLVSKLLKKKYDINKGGTDEEVEKVIDEIMSESGDENFHQKELKAS